jgi:hypothetical protein
MAPGDTGDGSDVRLAEFALDRRPNAIRHPIHVAIDKCQIGSVHPRDRVVISFLEIPPGGPLPDQADAAKILHIRKLTVRIDINLEPGFPFGKYARNASVPDSCDIEINGARENGDKWLRIRALVRQH